jgi:hypothetical protein
LFDMSNTLLKNCSCPPVEIVSIPGAQGSTGAAGTNGTNGINSFAITNANLTIPTTGTNTTVSVTNASWTVVGQVVYISDGTNAAHFQVTAIQTSPPVLTINALGNTGDSSATTVINTGAMVVPSGVQGPSGFTALATNSLNTAGSQNLTNTPAQALATTLTLAGAAAHTYLLFAVVRLDYAGASFSGGQVVTLSIRRTNNTAANVQTMNLATIPTTTLTGSMGQLALVAIPYTTVGNGDTIQPFISVSATPSAGNLNVVESSISALQLS